VTTSELFVELAITDSGIGMNDEVKRNVFDPFFLRQKMSTKEPVNSHHFHRSHYFTP